MALFPQYTATITGGGTEDVETPEHATIIECVIQYKTSAKMEVVMVSQ